MQSFKEWIASNKAVLVTIIIYTVIVGGVLLLLFSILPSKKTTPSSTIIPEVEQIKDANNKTAALIRQYNVERESNQHLIDSLAAALKLKPRQIAGIDRYVTVIDTVWKEKVVYKPASNDLDSTIITRQDDYVDIVAVGKPQGLSYINFKLRPDTLTRILRERTPLFGRPSTEVYLRHSNPYFQTPQGNSFIFNQKEPLFSIGISVGYDVIGNRLSVGPTITKPIKTFYKK